MPLAPGFRVGPYEIRGPLGEGAWERSIALAIRAWVVTSPSRCFARNAQSIPSVELLLRLLLLGLAPLLRALT